MFSLSPRVCVFLLFCLVSLSICISFDSGPAVSAETEEDGPVVSTADSKVKENSKKATAETKEDLAAKKAEDDMWVLEEVEDIDAPIVLPDGEGFRPTTEDKEKLKDIDAYVFLR